MIAAAKARWLRSSRHDLVLIEGGGHHPQADTPEPVAEALVTFLGDDRGDTN